MSDLKLCKFHKKCEYFSNDSSTCTHHGGDPYCGQYRKFYQEKELNIDDLDQEIDELSQQVLECQDPKHREIIQKKIVRLNNLKRMLQEENKLLKLNKKPEIEVP